MTPSYASPIRRPDPSFVEFVALIALQMALTALSIDVMLVALGDIAGTYHLVDDNDRQLVVTAYLAGFALGQPLAGPLSDSYGRKPILAVGIGIYCLAALGAAAAPSFGWLLVARVVQGLGGSAPRIISMAIVRDRFGGHRMAQVMSFVMMVFIIVPVVAPTLGSLVLRVASWHWVFVGLAAIGLLTIFWSMARLPETRPRNERYPLSGRSVARALRKVVKTRRTIGYAAGAGFLFGALMTYVGSSQQVFMEVYGLTQTQFPMAFGAAAAAIALASLLNARLVGRIGLHRVSHGALLLFVAASVVFAALDALGDPSLIETMAFLAVTLFCFGFVMPNFNAMAMEPMGAMAGMGSSVVGFLTTGLSASLGWLAGQAYDGTVRPLAIGFLSYSLVSLVVVLVTERGRLFEPPPPER
jgi:DHA1 family bicyclomycin/chloramphenicol resistance-like MFS transporter